MNGDSGDLGFAHKLRLLVCALRLFHRAQRLTGGESLETVRAHLLATPRLPVAVRVEDALWATRWAARGGRRLRGWLDTCLVRSLVTGALVSDAPAVAIRVGVHRPFDGADLLDAHAWLTVNDRPIADETGSADLFSEVFALAMERPT